MPRDLVPRSDSCREWTSWGGTIVPLESRVHGNTWKEFETIHRAARDLGGPDQFKIHTISPVILKSIFKRIGALLPSTRIYKAGCVTAADQFVGPAASQTRRTPQDLLLPPPDTAHDHDGQPEECVAPTHADSPMKWWRRMSPNSSSPNATNPSPEDKDSDNLPPVRDVYNAVFARRSSSACMPLDSAPALLNFWFLSFVNWFHDDNFRTVPNTNGSYSWGGDGGLHMTHVYGHTRYRQDALRTLQGDGKMKTSSSSGEWTYFPPLWNDVQQDYPDFDMWTPHNGPSSNSSAAGKQDVDTSAYFAMGDPRFNMHPGHIVWTSIALYLHNTACDILIQHQPQPQRQYDAEDGGGWTDEDIFQRARVITFHIVQKIRLQDFVSDSVSHARNHARLPYNPEELRQLMVPQFPFSGAKPHFLEFNHVYQAWHSLLPDALHLQGQQIPLTSLMWSPNLFANYSLAQISLAFSKTPIARYGPHNFPPFVRGITEQALADERAQRLPSYNAYRSYVGLPPLQSFDELAVDNPQQLQQLYHGDVNRLEFLTGILADSHARLFPCWATCSSFWSASLPFRMWRPMPYFKIPCSGATTT